jgi:uncharacterized protein (DUF2147 family)
MKKIIILSLAVILGFILQSFADTKEADRILGNWFTENNKSKIEIYKKDGKYFGKIVWLKVPNNEEGKPKVDKHNPNTEERTKPLLGLNLLKGFVYDEDDVWNDGYIYNPEDGKTYTCKMTLEEDGKTLNVRGYVGISLFGKTTVWKRVE